jgi:hypothetical protein
MNLKTLFKNFIVCIITVSASPVLNLLASETDKPIFKGNQAKVPDFSMLENPQKASITQSNSPPALINNLDLTGNARKMNRSFLVIVNKSLKEKEKNWLRDDVQKIKELRLERSKLKDENPSHLPETYYKKTDIFSLGINQGITQSISIQDSFKTNTLPQQVSSFDFKPTVFESSLNLGRDQSYHESILGTSSSLQIGLQNINQRPVTRDTIDGSSPSLLDDNLATKLNSPTNDFSNLKANPATSHPHQPSMLSSQNLKITPLNLNPSNSLQNLSDLNKRLNSDLSSNSFSPDNFNINKLLTPSINTSPKVFGNPNLNPNKIQDPLERLYR